MQARITYQGEVTIVHLAGRVDVETAQPFREACLSRLNSKKVVFDFKDLSFVGSSGILSFLDTLQEYAASNPQSFNFCGVGSEFRKVFAATPLHDVPIFEIPALASFALINPRPAVVVEAQIAAPLEQAANAEFGFLSLKPEAVAPLFANDDEFEA